MDVDEAEAHAHEPMGFDFVKFLPQYSS